MADIKLKSVYKIYDGNVEAVKDFNLEVKDKEFIVFVGPSGCGKSTTLRMIAGLEKITAGDIYIDNVRINDLEPRDRNIAMVFQNYALYPHMTVYKNLAFSLKITKTKLPVYDETEINRIITELGQTNRHLKKLRKEPDSNKKEMRLLEAKIESLKDDLEKAKENKVQKTFIDTDAIKETKKAISFYERQIESIKSYVAKAETKITNGYYKDDELEKINFAIKRCNTRIKDFNFAIENEKKILHKLETEEVLMYKMQKLSKEEIDRRVNEVAKMLEIEELLERKPKALSGGQRQRVAIGRAVIRNAKVFLMDEPLSNLDAKLRNQMRAELILLRKRINTTFVYVTHDQTEAMTLGDRIVIMKDGVIQQIGTPQDLFHHPANLFVGGFIGSPQMNFFDAKLEDDLSITIVNKNVKLNENTVAKLKERKVSSQQIVCGIRPEYFTISNEKDTNALEGEVRVLELMGSSVHVHISTECNKNVIMIVPILDASKNILNEIKVGEKIYFSWRLGLENLFSKETGLNLLPLDK